jgi:hypothetical protein
MTAIKAVIQFVKIRESFQWQVVRRVEEEAENRGDGEMEVEEGGKQQCLNL